ncbi:hypothetical protein ILUMI_21744 [Ignelater luminosus]|uniref:Integrase catalytic domain-containing protein n=1 Tax=Ignelater luminosus TaxID=2038154 RepID=A0A8K0CBH0_IGNLU|nr:hypothetical protein ILUMI_21744 [Ignelater luminosus]
MKPVFIKHKQVPYALQEKVDIELDELEANGVIERVNYFQWGSPLVVVPKPDGTLHREATAIYWSLHRFYPYIYDRKFTIVTDNKPLCHIFSPKKKLPDITAFKLLRYALFLSGFDYEIKYRRSQEHGNADYLSRAPLSVISNTTDIEYEIFKAPFPYLGASANQLERGHIDYAGPTTQAFPTTAVTIYMLQEIFSQHGLVVSDNAAIFISKAFTPLCQRNGIQHKTIAPGHPATNGQAETFTSITQNMLRRHHSQAEVVCKQPPALSSDCSGQTAPQLTTVVLSQTSAGEPSANATPCVYTIFAATKVN